MCEQIPARMFFKIGEVSRLTGVKPHVLRYWESEFDLIRPQKSKIGQRIYRRRDVEIILRLKKLLYEEGYTIAGAKKRLLYELRQQKLSSQPHSQAPNWIEVLHRQKEELKSLIKMLEK